MEMTIILIVLTAWGSCPTWMRQRGNTWHTPSMPGKVHPSGQNDMTVSALPTSLSGCGCVHIHLEENRSKHKPSADQHNHEPLQLTKLFAIILLMQPPWEQTQRGHVTSSRPHSQCILLQEGQNPGPVHAPSFHTPSVSFCIQRANEYLTFTY